MQRGVSGCLCQKVHGRKDLQQLLLGCSQADKHAGLCSPLRGLAGHWKAGWYCRVQFADVRRNKAYHIRDVQRNQMGVGFFPQIAIAIGVLTSNRGRGRRTTLADWTWHQGAIVGCHCSALWLGGRVTTNFGGVDVVPLQGAIVVRYGWGRVTAKFGEWTWCHCRVPV